MLNLNKNNNVSIVLQTIVITVTLTLISDQVSCVLDEIQLPFNVSCESSSSSWYYCFNQSINAWAEVEPSDKRACCLGWNWLYCWFNQVKSDCPESSADLYIKLEDIRLKLLAGDNCNRYYDISICNRQAFPLWANLAILFIGVVLITGLAVFVYWRWIRLI